MKFRYYSKSISWKHFMFHEMLLKMYFQKCSERKVSQCILAIILHIIMPYKTNDTFSSQLYAIVSMIFVLIYRCLNYIL